jgi:hypothetical protein
MTTTHEPDAFDVLGTRSNGIEGQHIRFAKGDLFVDGVETALANVQLCFIMTSIVAGEVRFEDKKIVEKRVGSINDGFVPADRVSEGWNRYLQVQCVRCDPDGFGQLCTFTSTSHGGYYAFLKLVNPYRRKGRMQFPICRIETKQRGDANKNIDPVFIIIAWNNISDFPDLLPPPVAAQLPAPAHVDVNDEIPF